jgi:hypothetical protein
VRGSVKGYGRVGASGVRQVYRAAMGVVSF